MRDVTLAIISNQGREMRARGLALAIGLLALMAGTGRAGTITLTCGEPSQPGTIYLDLTSTGSPGVNGSNANYQRLTIPGTDSAAEKCAAIAAAYGAGFTGSSVTVSGNVITFTDPGGPDGNLTGLFVLGDTTFETTTISVTKPPSTFAQLIEIPTASPTVDPAAGTNFCGSFLGSTFCETANGTENEVTLGGQMNSQITAATGLTFSTIVIQTGATSTVIALVSNPFDPSSVSITWDGNTAADLATFGLADVAIPEPGTLALTGTCLLALALLTRRAPW